jgi:hypothetical protein
MVGSTGEGTPQVECCGLGRSVHQRIEIKLNGAHLDTTVILFYISPPVYSMCGIVEISAQRVLHTLCRDVLDCIETKEKES